MVQIIRVSIKVPVMEIRPCSAGSLVLAAAAAMGAEPRPDSLENTPRAIPFCMAIMMVEPAKPPAAAAPVNADSKIRATAAGTPSRFMTIRPRLMAIYITAIKGITLEATLAMLCRPPMVIAAMRTVSKNPVSTLDRPKEISALSTIALTCGKVPIPKYATRIVAAAKNVASGLYFSPMP